MGRIEKVNDLIRDALAKTIFELCGGEFIITVTKVDVSKDLRQADAWISILDDDPQEKFDFLKNQQGLIRKEIASKISLKHVPRIELRLDKSGEYSAKIEKILRKIKNDDNE